MFPKDIDLTDFYATCFFG